MSALNHEDDYIGVLVRATREVLALSGVPNDQIERFLSVRETSEIRKVLGDALIALRKPATKELCEAMDGVLRAENGERKIVESSRLEPHLYVDSHCAKGKSAVEIVIWRGDICTLRVDAIVNAANGAMLGCFQPSHRCIDNVIHRCAGPRLREACRKVIQTECVDEDGDDVGASGREGWELRTGDARITKAFGNLPSSFVLHTVGPIVPKTFLGRATRPTSVHRAQLAQCYTSCLRLADEMGVKSIAFCCISTGLFGYPYVYISIDIVVRRTMHQCLRASIEHSARRRQKEAASVALQSVKEYFERNVSSVTRVVFNTFLKTDHRIYLHLTMSMAPKDSLGRVFSKTTRASEKNDDEDDKDCTTLLEAFGGHISDGDEENVSRV